MKYDFDEVISRRGTLSYKWDNATDAEVLPLWVADMDFRTSPAIIEALQRRVAHGIFGYTRVPDAYYQAVTNWFARRHGWNIQREWMIYTSGVVPAVSAVIKALTVPGDKVLVQMGRGDLVLVGARPGMGKTSFAMNIATNVAKSTKKAVCIFSLEMSGEQLVNRMLSSEALVDSYSLRSGELKPEDWERLADATSELAGCEILIDDTSGITATDMKAKLRRVRNLGLVVIDYLQLMQSGRNIENRVQEVGDISRNLKIMAKDLGVPIICCAQLSRGPESRTVKKPMLSDLRDSGAIEQDADIVMFLYREEYYKDAEGAKDNIAVNTAEVIIAKNRHGSTGTVEMGWNGQFTKFRTVDDDREPAPGT